MPRFKKVVIISDGIRGHFHQSLGIARWLERLDNTEIQGPVEVPKLSGLKKFFKLKLPSRKIPSSNKNYSEKFLSSFGIDYKNFLSPETLFISAGSSAAPFCLALAKATENKSAVIMTPSVLGTKPFDFAIIPEHDKKSSEKNLITTLGAANHIFIPELKDEAASFFAGKNFSGKVLTILVGGSDANYKPDAEWVRKALGPLKDFEGVKILITTSRRSGQAVENEIEKIFKDSPALGYMLLLSREPEVKALPAMLGAATHVLVTEDSVSMVSEAATAGFKVGLLRVPKTSQSIKKILGYGTQRFDEMFLRMEQENLIEDLGMIPDLKKFLAPPEQKHNKNFNEARRVAEWIIKS